MSTAVDPMIAASLSNRAKPPELPDIPICADDVPAELARMLEEQQRKEWGAFQLGTGMGTAYNYGINMPKIGDYCTALEDGSGVYWDPEFAKKTHFGGVISPWGAISQSGGGPHWTPKWMPGREEYPLREGLKKAAEKMPDEVADRYYFKPFMNFGLDEVIDIGGTIHYYGPLKLGDMPVHGRLYLWGVRKWPSLRLGDGYEFQRGGEIFNMNGEKVGFHAFRRLFFKRNPRQDASNYARRREATVSMEVGGEPNNFATRFWDDVEIGEDLMAYALHWHWHRMLWIAAATGDYYPWHADPQYAAEGGKRGMFVMHTATEGLYCRLLSDSFGPEVEPRFLKYDILRSICTDDTTITGGRVTGKREQVNPVTGALEGVLDLRLEIWNTVEDSLSGQAEATVCLPRR